MPQTILSAAAAEGQLNLLKSGAFADFKVICDDREFKVHRAILCPTSTYFSKICAEGFVFKVGISSLISRDLANLKQEGAEAAVHLNGDDPDIVSRIILYQYTKGYDAGNVPQIGTEIAVRQNEDMTIEDHKQENRSAAPATAVQVGPTLFKTKAGLEITMDQAEKYLLVHAEVYTCADKLGIEELKEYACTQFVNLAGDEGMKLHRLQFYGQLLGYIYDNTMLESTQNKGSGPAIHKTSGLRYAATMCAVQTLGSAAVAETISKAIKEHEPMAWEVATAMREKEMKLERKKRSLEVANATVAAKGTEEMAYGKRVVRKLQTLLNRNRKCERCNKDLKAGTITVEGASSRASAVVVVTCRSCTERLTMDI
jgi:hypothetical protein